MDNGFVGFMVTLALHIVAVAAMSWCVAVLIEGLGS